MVEQELCGFGLPCATLSADDHCLVLTVVQHGVVSIVGDGEYVGRQLSECLT